MYRFTWLVGDKTESISREFKGLFQLILNRMGGWLTRPEIKEGGNGYEKFNMSGGWGVMGSDDLVYYPPYNFKWNSL